MSYPMNDSLNRASVTSSLSNKHRRIRLFKQFHTVHFADDFTYVSRDIPVPRTQRQARVQATSISVEPERRNTLRPAQHHYTRWPIGSAHRKTQIVDLISFGICWSFCQHIHNVSTHSSQKRMQNADTTGHIHLIHSQGHISTTISTHICMVYMQGVCI